MSYLGLQHDQPSQLQAQAERRAASRARSSRLLGRLSSCDVETQSGERIAITGPEWLRHFAKTRPV
jgi:hypothetical protein